jgi:hypothetical protein
LALILDNSLYFYLTGGLLDSGAESAWQAESDNAYYVREGFASKVVIYPLLPQKAM